MIRDRRPELTDHLIQLYCDWRMRCEEVRTTYARLDSAPKAPLPTRYHIGMHGGDYILMARRRAGLSQRELAERLGCRQATVARWERDDRHPSLEETEAAVRVCGFDLAVNLVEQDRSWWRQIAVQLERTPVERLWSLTPPDSPDLLPILDAIAHTDAIVIGEVAGALHGWPVVLSGTGIVEVLGGEPGEHVRVVDELPGVAGLADLRRDAETVALPFGAPVKVAGLLDLLRIADAADGGTRSRETLALQGVIEVERARARARPPATTDKGRLHAGLDQQQAAACLGR